MKNTDRFIIGLLLITGVWLLFSKHEIRVEKVSPDEMYKKIVEKTRFYTTEQVAQMIISKDPSLQLIDVRNPESYSKYTLNGAVNIPLKDLLKKENLDYFDQDVYNTVLFSNGTIDAETAWILTTRLGYKNVYVMRGGLNAWVENILKPKAPEGPWDEKADELYQYRLGASQYFGGGKATVSTNDTPKKKKKVVKRKKKEVSGGCG